LPLPNERRGIVLRPIAGEKDAGRRMLFDDESDIVSKFDLGRAAAQIETGDRFAGSISLAAKKEATGAARLPGVEISIREKPRAGEYRYVRFAWKKRGGGGIALAFAMDGAWDADGRPARYASGTEGTFLLSGSRRVHDGCPDDWVVVTRDAFADFGAINITGFSLNPIRGACFRLGPQRYPPRLPSLRITRWQGTTTAMEFAATADATARTASGRPIAAASSE
jgi:hypothetical protein